MAAMKSNSRKIQAEATRKEIYQASIKLKEDVAPEEITEFLFIAARGVCYDWCAHDGSYDLQEFMKKYMKSLIEIYAVK